MYATRTLENSFVLLIFNFTNQFVESFGARVSIKTMDKKTFECEKCNVTFKSQIGYKRHKEFIHKDPNIEIKHECNICNKTFKTKGNLDYHTRNVHELTKHLQCELCNFKAKYPSHLKLHYIHFY